MNDRGFPFGQPRTPTDCICFQSSRARSYQTAIGRCLIGPWGPALRLLALLFCCADKGRLAELNDD